MTIDCGIGVLRPFPHPYTLADARSWIEFDRSRPPGNDYAIEVDGRLAGRGIATAACRSLTAHAFATTRVRRIEAGVFHPNLASARVLEKAGYVLEETVKNGVTRGEQTYDKHLYVKVRQ